MHGNEGDRRWVFGLCADWCGVCTEWRAVFVTRLLASLDGAGKPADGSQAQALLQRLVSAQL